jgi:hypothetical protein
MNSSWIHTVAPPKCTKSDESGRRCSPDGVLRGMLNNTEPPVYLLLALPSIRTTDVRPFRGKVISYY